MSKLIGVLTSGGDTPGLNAAIRGLGKSCILSHNFQVLGFLDGFRGLMENRTMRLEKDLLSGILTTGGTILGTSRDKPHRMLLGGKSLDMTDMILENYHKHHLDALVCIGGGGTQKNAYKLSQRGLNIVTLPKTIDNDVFGTDTTFGFNTAMTIATEAIDRLHSTAHSHHRIIVVETMGHKAGWLSLGAGLAGGADVILIPEIPYNIEKIAESILKRSRSGKRFSIVAIAEGCVSDEKFKNIRNNPIRDEEDNSGNNENNFSELSYEMKKYNSEETGTTLYLAKRLEQLTRLESRVTILGHVQRGGTPSPYDRLLATRMGTACAESLTRGDSGVMIALKGQDTVPVPLDQVAGKKKLVPLDHQWIDSARKIGISFGD